MVNVPSLLGGVFDILAFFFFVQQFFTVADPVALFFYPKRLLLMTDTKNRLFSVKTMNKGLLLQNTLKIKYKTSVRAANMFSTFTTPLLVSK